VAAGRIPPLLRALLALALSLLAGGMAAAQCAPAKGATELSIGNFATATFLELKTDASHDQVDLYGKVCVSGRGWTLAADVVKVAGANAEIRITAQRATVTVRGWTARAASLTADSSQLTLQQVMLTGHGVDGRAASAVLDLSSGELRLGAIDLHGAAFYLSGDSATLAGDQVTVAGPGITTCHCAGPPLYRVSGASARLDARAEKVVLSDGQVTVMGVHVPLGTTVTIDAQTLKSLALPLSIEYLPSDAASGEAGTGLGVILTHLGLAPGVYARVGATGLDADYPLASEALLKGQAGGTSFTFGKAPGGMRFVERSDQALTPWLDAGFDTRVLEPGNRDRLREGALHARAHTAVPALRGNASLDAVAAASAQSPGSGPVAGARLGISGSALVASAADATWGQAQLRVGASLTGYPDQRAVQWGVRAEPSYLLDAGPLSLRLAYLTRFTNSGSPFTTSLDRLEPAQRASGRLSLSGAPAPGWRASAKVSAQYDLVGNSTVAAGLNRLNVSGSLTRSLRGWDLTGSVDAVLAGVLAPNGDRDGYLQLGLDAHSGELALGARARYRVAPGPQGLDLLQVSAAVPLQLPGVVVRPYLAVDFAPTVAGGALPAISGHGLDLTIPSCCGAIKIGYRDQDGTISVSLALDLKTGASSVGAVSCPSGTAATTIVADAAATPPVCAAGGAGAGIMTGAATGPPL